MSDLPASAPQRLSELLQRRGSRRAFLARASALGITIPAALAACERSEPSRAQTPESAQAGTSAAAQQPRRRGIRNPDSRADSLLHHPPTPTTGSGGAGAANVAFARYDPTLPPLAATRTVDLHWTARDAPIRILPDVVVSAWTFEGMLPGPLVHVRQGDTVRFTLTNRGTIPHSMDFHAAQVNPATAFRSVAPGDSVSYAFRPRYAGAFVYHCGTAPVLMHIGSGMFGALVVDPPTPLPHAKEFVLVQNEFYLAPEQNGVRAFDYAKMLQGVPDYFSFNGRPGQYQTEPIRVERGDRVRFYVVNAGPTESCGFHVVGEQFDTVYLGAPPGSAIHGVQTFGISAGGGMIFELMADIPGEFPFVNHDFGHGQKGAIGILKVE